VRSLGGIVLLAAVAWCAWRWRRQAGLASRRYSWSSTRPPSPSSHVLGDCARGLARGVTVAAVVGLAAWMLADAPASRLARAPAARSTTAERPPGAADAPSDPACVQRGEAGAALGDRHFLEDLVGPDALDFERPVLVIATRSRRPSPPGAQTT
jgi:hypothetical protein